MRAFIAALCVASVLVAALCVPALGEAPNPERQALLDSTVGFLQESQEPDGGFAEGGEVSQGTSAWAALALAAAGINPRNQARPCGSDAYTYLVANFRASTGEEVEGDGAQITTNSFERELLVVDAAGADPHDFAGFDLVGKILGRQLPDGSFPDVPGDEGQINTTAFAILSLSPIAEPAIAPALGAAAEWLIAQQGADGGWGWQKGMVSEVDVTGAAIEALSAAEAAGASAQGAAIAAAQERAFAYLEDAQRPDGGFPARPGAGSESNVASTAWAVQGIWSAGGDPETWRTGSGLASEEPLDYMESMQQPDGHIRWSASADANGLWMTAYVVPAFAGHALPIPAAIYSAASRPPCDPRGESENTGAVAGGGGRGAPFFSRPKPQSKGKTPGGARVVESEGLRSRSHGRSRRGENAEQPAGTASAEPSGTDAGEEGEGTARSSSAGSGERGKPGVPVPAPMREAAGDATAGGEHEISGVVIGDAGSELVAYGAPGLRSADGGGDPEPWVAIAIGVAALLAALVGARWERRPREVLA